MIAVQLFAAYEVLEVDMSARLGIPGFGVVIQFVRAQEHVGGLQAHVAPEMPDDTHGVLGDGFNMDMLRVRRARARRGRLLVGVGAQGRYRRRRG